MRVLYDYQILYLQKYGGISRYFYELISHLESQYEQDSFNISAAISQNYYFREKIPQRKLLKHGNRMINDLQMKMKTGNIDILHPTYYEPSYIADYSKRKYKLVITVHDMTYEHFMQDNTRFIQAKRKMLEYADGIITISDFTRKDLVQIYPTLEHKPISTIYLGFAGVSGDMPLFVADLPSDYILYVGARGGYKDFHVVLNAFRQIKEKYSTLYLICAGGGAFSNEERNLINGLGIGKRIIQRDFTDEEMHEVYKKAGCFIYPSRYEGFGLPILEAFNSECPVLLRNASCFPEIAGNAVLYFENEDDLAQQIMTVYEDEEVRNKLVSTGKMRLNIYSWDDTARQTHDFYEGVLQN